MKKLLSITAVLAIVLSVCVLGIGTVASAAEESAEEDFLVFEGILEEYIGDGGDVVIPASLGVTEIAERAFYENKDITSVVIPEGVKAIGSKAFFYCSNLVAVTLPYSLEELTEHEFSGCGITELVIPGKLDVISYGCFSSCFYLTELTISYGVEEILPLAFQGTSMDRVVFPETVELICGNDTFGNNKDTEATKIEYYICNPRCEIGSYVTGTVKAQKHQWTGVNSPWNSNKANPQYRIYVIEGSDVDTFLTEQGETLLHGTESGKGDSLKIYRESSQFFKDLPENQSTYGVQAPVSSSGNGSNTNPGPNPGSNTNPGPNPGSNTNPGGNTNPGDGSSNIGGDVSTPDGDGSNTIGGNGDTTGNGNKVNSSGGGTTTTIPVVQPNNSVKWIILLIGIFGGLMFILIIVVVILAATGKLGGSKKAKSTADEVEDLNAKMETPEIDEAVAEAEVEAPAAEDAE